MKQSKMTRFMLVVLALSMVLVLFASCASNTDDNKPTPTPTGNVSGTPTPTEEPRVDHGITGTYEYTINVLHWSDGSDANATASWIPWEEVAVEDRDTGDILVEDVFDRNAWVEENYGIMLTNEYKKHGEYQNTMNKMLTTGDNDYQLYISTGYGLCNGGNNLFGSGHFLDMSQIETIDLSHPWWSKSSIEELSIGVTVEFCVSDILLLDKGATTCIFYNKTMAQNLGLDNLYDVVRNKEWTIETMADYASLANMDLDGNDTIDGNDQWGIVGGDDPVLSFYLSSGNHFIRHTDDGYYEYEFGSAETLSTMADIFDIIMYGDFFYNGWLKRGAEVSPSFNEGDALFSPGYAKTCMTLRRYELEYGIVPNPIADLVYQEEYGAWVHSYHGSVMGIPFTCPEPETVGAALEVLGYYSYYEIASDLYNTVICDRGTRDDESVEMLKIIFGNRIYDFGVIKDVQSFTDNVLRFTATGSSNLQTLIDSKRDILDDHIENLNDMVDNY